MTEVKITDNLNVIRLWRVGKNARNHRESLRAQDGNLWSYNKKIGVRTGTGICVVGNYTAAMGGYHSQTTSIHVNLAKKFAHTVFHPLVCESSPLFTEEVPF